MIPVGLKISLKFFRESLQLGNIHICLTGWISNEEYKISFTACYWERKNHVLYCGSIWEGKLITSILNQLILSKHFSAYHILIVLYVSAKTWWWDLCMNSCTAIIYSVNDVTGTYHYSFSLTNCVPRNLDEFRRC